MDVIDYSEHDGYWHRRRLTILSVFEKCGGNFLLACKDCYNLEPRVVAEFAVNGSQTCCECCKGTSVIFLHEHVTQNDKGMTFYEYQIIRERLSDTLANYYCRHRNSCFHGEKCRYVHTYKEMIVWQMESTRKSERASRKNLARDRGSYRGQIFHCPDCCLNFKDHIKYNDHLKTNFHIHMQRIRGNGKDVTWKYKPCQTEMPEKCPSDEAEEDCDCQHAHSERELLEWKTRKEIRDARNSYVEEVPRMNRMSHLHERMQKETVQEFKNSSQEKIIQMQDKEILWQTGFQIPETYKEKIQQVSFLQPVFTLRRTVQNKFVQYLPIVDRKWDKLELMIRFENPKIFGQYSGTLVFDFGSGMPIIVTNYNVTVRGEDEIEQSSQVAVLSQNWSLNRIVIAYPVEDTGEVHYESNVSELERTYPIPRAESLDNVYLENLTRSTYAKQMHNFLYKEELARQAVLSRLNIESEMIISEHLYTENSFIGSKNDGSLYATFTSPTRLSTDSDEGVLVRDSCSKVLIGRKKEESALAYQCKIEFWENNKVYLRLPARCVVDLGLKSGQNIVLIVQYKLDRSIFCQRHYAIDALGERINLICPLEQTYAKLNDSPMNSEYLDATQNSVLSKIHAEKRRERFNSGEKCYPPLVVAGPFGTGKTHTIRNVILEILQRNGADSRILLCTHSNSAADLYIKDIVSDPRWSDWTDKILRVMYHKRNIRTVLVQEVKDFCLFVDDRSTFRYPTLNELRKYRIVITTFSTSVALGQLGVGLRTGAFTHIFLDEASQAMEPEVIMPLALANSDTTRIIIAGDHRQINERMFLSDDAKIPTLLERMYNAYKENYKQHRLLLCNNYRCVDGLLQLISKLFYKEDILKSTGDAQLLPGYNNAVHFVHVQGRCRMTDAGDFINGSEANQVVTEVENLLTVVGQKDIMVSSPYFSQVQLIRDLLRKKRMGAVNVFSARNVQALQYKVVILSSVLRRIDCLSSGGSNFGFLSNLNLLNTVLTRAKSLVIAVGDAVALCSTGQCAKKWESFLQHCERFNAIQPEHINLRAVRADVQLARLHLRAEAKEFVPVRHGITQSPLAVMQSPAGACAILGTGASRKDDSEFLTDDKEEDEDDDPILDDMLKKSLGYDPNRLYVETDDKGNETVKYDHDLEDTDPNETHITPSEKYAGRKEIFPKHSVGKLEAMLEESPNEYKRCRIHIKNWFTAEAVELENSNSIIYLQTKNHLGRTFDQDEVVVKIINEERNGTHQKKSCGQVMGILKRHRNPRQGYYICRPDEYNNGIMAPIEKSCTKFAIITPKDHKTKNPGKIPVYKINYTKASYTNLTLVSCDKINWNCAYAVKYLKWAEYHPYPLGYVAEIISLQDPQKCLELEFGVSDTKKQAVVDQALKTEVPVSNPADALEVFTIDPEGAKDLDDALSLQDCKEHSDCSLLGVHVTDVASLLPKDSPADQAAQTQGGSFYGTDHVQHMLPEELSTNKLSLLPKKTRSAISIFFHTSTEPPHISGRDWHIVPQKSLVRSLRQMTYGQAEDVLRGTHPGKTGLDAKIKKLWEVLWGWRVARLGDAAFFEDFNSYKELLEEGRAHLLVEEAMIAFNANIANYLISKGFNIHLRVQQLPQIKLWKKWFYSNSQSVINSPYLISNSDYIGAKHKRKRLFTRTLPGYEKIIIPPGVSEITSTPHTSDSDLSREMKRYMKSSSVQDCVVLYSTVWEDISRYLREGDLETALFIIASDFLHPSQVSALDQYHSIQNRSEWVARQGDDTLHSSLRILRYTKCTSPIRRYPDIVIQRCIHRALEGLRPTVDTGRIRWDIDDRVKKFKYKFEVAELAKTLSEQPSVIVACISMITDAGLRLSFPSQGDCVPSRVRELEYAHLMLDLEEKGLSKRRKENKKREIRNHAGDVILDQINAVWRFRFYDYAKYSNEAATKLAPKSDTEESLTVRINQREWRTLVKAMQNPPGRNTSDQKKARYRKNVKRALEELSFKPHDPSTLDDMCGETRNNPIPVKHRREIRKRLIPGSVVQIQLSSWFGKDRLPEPCVQLLKLTPDLSICLHHNRQPLHIFAHDAKIKENRVESLKKYQKTWEPLIRLDSAFNAVTDASSFVLEGVKIAWNLFSDAETMAGDAGTNLQISDHNFKIEAAFCRERYIEFHVNDLLCLRLPGVPNISHNSFALLDNKHSTHTVVLHGAIVSVGDRKQRQKSPIRSGKITVVFKVFATRAGNTDVFWNEENLWTIEVIPLSFLHRQMQSSLHKLTRTKNKLVEQIALKRTKNEEELVTVTQMARSLFSGPSLNGFPFPLNENQTREKNKAIKRKFTVIQGPPGTGKSYLGAHIAATFSLMNRSTNSKNPQKVLYCGPSNKAVDVAARFLKNAHDVKVVRMYSTSLEEKVFPNPLKPKPVIQSPTEDSKMPDEKLNDIALHNLIRQKQNNWADAITKFDSDVRDPTKRFTRKEIDSYKAMVTRAKIEELKNCDIIVCTCSLSTLLYELKDDGEEIMQFSQCIIDESGMCSEPETMLPLIVANPNQVVLIGDHKQLQPVIKCKKAERLGLGESLFSKYSNMAGMLTVQYRMDPEIMKFPSQTFYDGRLLCDDSVRKRRKISFFHHFPTENNVFWHMEGIEQQQKFRSIRGGHKSKYNMEEAKAVIKLLIYLTKNSPAKLKPVDIMVLSPYTAQCARIQDIIKKEGTQLKDVHVGTIVTSQGSEADFVILSTVRSIPESEIHAEPSPVWKQKHLGFVCDPHQINVALTRAKRGLCVIGNGNLLQVDELWEKLINMKHMKSVEQYMNNREAYEERGAVHEQPFFTPSSAESNSSSTDDYDSDSLYEQEFYDMMTEDEDEENSESEFSIEDFW